VRQVMANMRKYTDVGIEIIPFQIGEPDFYTPVSIIEATKEALDKKMTRYSSNRGSLKLKKAISTLLSAKNLSYNPDDEILMTVGGAEAIYCAITAFISAGDEVIIPTPSYMNYKNDVAMAKGTVIDLPLREEDDFQINIKALEEKITDHTKMIVINNPSNPTGVVFRKDVLEAVAAIAVKYDLIVFTDEIYDEITYDGVECVSIASFDGMKDRCIVMNGFSKAFAMTGWRIGYLAAPAEAITAMLKVHQYAVTCIPTFTQEGLAQAMLSSSCVADKNKMVASFSRRRKLILDCLKEIPEVSYAIPQGAFYVFINIGATGLTGEEFASRLLEEKHVAVVPGNGFSDDAVGYIRISFATSEENIKMGMQRIKDFIASVKIENNK
ncbi:MAG: pyridoxal phosphate-dependent aminotransferase, partial [Sphaerochaetaceae bacterium]|nr:pyridoxal phosphate-dependent aminotransferase [Sphaerochaetaceae bacterium]